MDASRRTRGALILIAPILAVAVVAGIVSVSSRGDAGFVYDQRGGGGVDPRELEALIQRAPEPTPRGPGAAARGVRCARARGSAQPAGEWSCAARYPSGRTIRYAVTVRSDGSYTGADRSGQFLVRGCCVEGAAAAN